MGCLKSILKKLLIIIAIVAFFAFGGWAFVKDKVKEYKYPPREVFVETEIDFANFKNVSGDYQLHRCFNFFGYKKIIAKYLPTEQKIAIYDLKNEDLISPSDFYNDEINQKIDVVLKKFENSIVTYDNFKIIEKNEYLAKNKKIPYVKFSANVRNIPFKEVIGTIGAYSTLNKKQQQTTKLIVLIVDDKAYNPKIMKDFVEALEFNIIDE